MREVGWKPSVEARGIGRDEHPLCEAGEDVMNVMLWASPSVRTTDMAGTEVRTLGSSSYAVGKQYEMVQLVLVHL